MKLKDKVLVVEDEQNISNFISTVLTANDFDVLVAQTGAEAISMITSHCPNLIILDLGLPDMDGQAILKEVRSWSNLPIIVVSARTHEHDKVAALDLGADDYIEKPFGTSELLARIRAMLRRKEEFTPEIVKCGDLSLIYSDDEYSSYSNIFGNAKTDITDEDKDRLIASLKSLNENSDIEDVVNMDEVIRYFVVHNFVCNFDSYTGSMIHNYYLYEEDGQLSMIPWDYNLAFGGFSAGSGDGDSAT